MRLTDLLTYATNAFSGYKTRTILLLIAMAIGVCSVVMLSTLGNGARGFVVGQFSSLGTNLLIIFPGRSETVGGPPPMLGVTPRDLTLDDSQALFRSSKIRYVAPLLIGAVPVSQGAKEREVTIMGSSPQLYDIRQLKMAQGRFIPKGDIERQGAVCVLGHKTKTELFGKERAVGEKIRIGDRRYRVIGVLAPKGESLGFDMSDVVIIPIASAQALFNSNSLFRVLIEVKKADQIENAKRDVLNIIKQRHDGEDDITVVTQDAVLTTFNKILTILTLAVTGIGIVSVGVAGVLIMNVMLIAVAQRRAEIGLLKALGTTNRKIIMIFLTEAGMLSLCGGIIGISLACGGIGILSKLFPIFPISVPSWSIVTGIAVAVTTGIIFGIMPAVKAARLNPVLSLSRR